MGWETLYSSHRYSLTFLGSLTMRSVLASLRATLSVVSPSRISTVVLNRPV